MVEDELNDRKHLGPFQLLFILKEEKNIFDIFPSSNWRQLEKRLFVY
jgi:hypothetical protein